MNDCPDPNCPGHAWNSFSPLVKGEVNPVILKGQYGEVCHTFIAGSDRYPHVLNLWVPSECGYYRPEFGEWTVKA